MRLQVSAQRTVAISTAVAPMEARLLVTQPLNLVPPAGLLGLPIPQQVSRALSLAAKTGLKEMLESEFRPQIQSIHFKSVEVTQPQLAISETAQALQVLAPVPHQPVSKELSLPLVPSRQEYGVFLLLSAATESALLVTTLAAVTPYMAEATLVLPVTSKAQFM